VVIAIYWGMDALSALGIADVLSAYVIVRAVLRQVQATETLDALVVSARVTIVTGFWVSFAFPCRRFTIIPCAHLPIVAHDWLIITSEEIETPIHSATIIVVAGYIRMATLSVLACILSAQTVIRAVLVSSAPCATWYGLMNTLTLGVARVARAWVTVATKNWKILALPCRRVTVI
jgi:hypothetical protein